MNTTSMKHNPLDPSIDLMYGDSANKSIASHVRFKSRAFLPYILKSIFPVECGVREAHSAIDSTRNSTGILYFKEPAMQEQSTRSTKPTSVSPFPSTKKTNIPGEIKKRADNILALIEKLYVAQIGPLPIEKRILPSNWSILPGGRMSAKEVVK